MKEPDSQGGLLDRRRAGVLLPIRSLPDGPGNGDLGRSACHFVDFAASSGWTVWQFLPVGPPDGTGSPYLARSAFAGDPDLIGLDRLVELGWIDGFESTIRDPLEAHVHRRERLASAQVGFREHADGAWRGRLETFCHKAREWLDDFALFSVIEELESGASWSEWPAPLRDRAPPALTAIRERHARRFEEVRFEQFLFATQWQALHAYAAGKGVRLLGDLPMFVALHSVDVWAHRELFRLDASGQPTVVAGVPPDYFSADGQRWGNPLYDWAHIQATHFDWWIKRVGNELERFDVLRLDHFRGLEATWEIPVESATARDGHWIPVPGAELLMALERAFDRLPLIAEDLGVITPEVTLLRERFGLPGMRVLQFAFDGDAQNPHLPHNLVAATVVYTGTHDNPPSRAWAAGIDPITRERVEQYTGRTGNPLSWTLIVTALATVARLAVIPLQDWLDLGAESRINTPGTVSGNWRWRFSWSEIPSDLTERSRYWVSLFGR